MTLTYYNGYYQEIFQGCISYLDSSSLTQEIIGSHTITNTNSVSLGSNRFGLLNKSMIFSGANNLSIADSDDWYFGTSDFEIFFIVTLSGVSSSMYFFGQYADTNNFHTFQIVSNGAMYWGCKNGGSMSFNLLTQVNTTGTYYISVLQRSSVLYFYVNGVLKTSGTYSGTPGIPNLASPFYIGWASDSNYLVGNIDTIIVWKSNAPSPETLFKLFSKKTTYPIMPGKRNCK